MVHTNKNPLDSYTICNVDVLCLQKEEALNLISERITSKKHAHYAYLNVHGANLAVDNPEFRDCLRHFDILCDGIGVDIAAKLLYGKAFPDNLNGTDFTPALIQHIKTPLHISLFGAEEGIAERAIETLKKSAPHHRYSVLSHGFVKETDYPDLLEGLAKDRPDILLVALGNPHQEFWIRDNCYAEHALAVFGVGALFDFLAGRVTRAPQWIRAIRCEWIYRLAQEPNRLWKRYILGNPRFLLRILKDKYARPHLNEHKN